MEPQFPNLLIIGAMKAGTTSLHDYLKKHPDIHMSEPKELHFYDKPSNLSLDNYKAHFISDKKILGTSPQNYTKAHHPNFAGIPEMIYKDSPDVKLIYIVRNPFKRIISHYLESKYIFLKPGEKMPEEPMAKTSMFHYQISEYLKFFKREQIHICTLEDLISNKLEVLNRIFDFLEVSRIESEEEFQGYSNDYRAKKTPFFLRQSALYRLIALFSDGFADFLGSKWSRRFYPEYYKKPSIEELINPELIQMVKEDAAKFEKEFGVNLFLDEQA